MPKRLIRRHEHNDVKFVVCQECPNGEIICRIEYNEGIYKIIRTCMNSSEIEVSTVYCHLMTQEEATEKA
jgi:hypothetical protein